jgi:recombination protein RecT
MKTDGSDQNTKGRELSVQQKEVNTLRGELQKMTGEFSKALANKIDPERMVRIVLTAVQTTPKLAECSRVSFFGAVMKSCQLSLEPNTPLGQAYLIPRWNGAKKCTECNFQLGYQGVIELCYRTKEYKRITAEIVYDGDDFNFEYGIDADLTHKPLGKTEKPIFVYALYELTNGGLEFKVWSWEKVMRHAEEFSESFDKSFSPWKSNRESQEAMAKKTVLLNLLKYAPKSVEVADAVNSDEHVLNLRRFEDSGRSFYSVDVEDVVTEPVTEKKPEKETVPVGNEGAAQTQNVEATASPQGKSATATATTGNAGNGQNSGLFSQDEEAALEEQWNRMQGGATPPDFD